MKKLNYLVLGLAAITMASCSQEEMNLGTSNGDGNFNITVKLPGDMGTRALGDGFTATTLEYAVYDVTSGEAKFSFQDEATFDKTSLTTTVSLNLIEGKQYQIAFFAYFSPEGAPQVYSFDPSADTPNISVDYEAMTGELNNEDAYDCFFALTDTYTVSSNNTPQSVTLSRPVAQINWGTNDIGKNKELDVTYGENGEYIQSNLKVTGTVYSQLNFMEKKLAEPVENLTLFATNQEQIPQSNFPVDPETYQYVACQYLLVPVDGTTYDLTLNIDNGANDGPDDKEKVIQVYSAPVQANYRTNIYGTLLSANATFEVTKEPIFAGEYNSVVGGATVSVINGKVTCITPNLPEGVSEQDMKDQSAGAVAIGADGNPVYFQPTSADINKAMSQYSEIYFAPNAIITTKSHGMQLVATNPNVTIHGNGATLQGEEQDFAIQYIKTDGNTLNLTINNLNNVKVWGGPAGVFTLNLYMNNCTMNGKGRTDSSNLIMTRGGDNYEGTVNWYIDGCQVNNVQVAMHSTYPGTIIINNCKFNGVGIPLNYAKKTAANAKVTITDCVFNDCGIIENDPDNKAWNYAAPIRVVDFAGPAMYSTTLLVDGCTFKNTLSQWDILLWDYRTDETRTSYPVDLTLSNCTPADPSVNTITQVTTSGPSN